MIRKAKNQKQYKSK